MARKNEEITFEEVVERGCGLDVHKKEIVATVSGTGISQETRSFQSTTRSLTELKEWLLALGVTHVAMVSTGVYWKPVMNILEPGGFTIMVVNARHIKYVPGHKTDKKDSAWICKLLRAGLLKGSFIPCREQRDLRDLTRYRRKLVQQQASEHNRMIRIFEDANLKLSSVFSNIRGKTCTAVIDAVIAGETNPDRLADLCTHWRLKSTREEISLAVEGCFTDHHRFMIHAIRRSIRNIEEGIDHLDKEIERRMQPIEDSVRQLCEVPGMDTKSARYKKLAARRGKKRALVAIAAEMLKVVYHMLKDGTAYQEMGDTHIDPKRKDAQIKYYREQLNKLLGGDLPGTQSA